VTVVYVRYSSESPVKEKAAPIVSISGPIGFPGTREVTSAPIVP
jgi:hypothetical protein